MRLTFGKKLRAPLNIKELDKMRNIFAKFI